MDKNNWPNPSISPEETSLAPLYQYFQTLRNVLIRPRAFFSEQSDSTSPILSSVTFALVTSWIGSALQYISESTFGNNRRALFDGIVHRFTINEYGQDTSHMDWVNFTQERLQEWYWGLGPVIIDPFITLIQVFFLGTLLFLGARIFVTPGENGARNKVDFESAIALASYSFAPSIVAFIPFLGSFGSQIYGFVICVLGASALYRISVTRSLFIAGFPNLIILSPLLLFLLFLALIFGLVSPLLFL